MFPAFVYVQSSIKNFKKCLIFIYWNPQHAARQGEPRKKIQGPLSEGKRNSHEELKSWKGMKLSSVSGRGKAVVLSFGMQKKHMCLSWTSASRVKSTARPACWCKVEAWIMRDRLLRSSEWIMLNKYGIIYRTFTILFNESRHHRESLATQSKWAISYQGKIVFAAFSRWVKYFTKQFYIPKTFVCLGNAGCFTLCYLLWQHNFSISSKAKLAFLIF